MSLKTIVVTCENKSCEVAAQKTNSRDESFKCNSRTHRRIRGLAVRLFHTTGCRQRPFGNHNNRWSHVKFFGGNQWPVVHPRKNLIISTTRCRYTGVFIIVICSGKTIFISLHFLMTCNMFTRLDPFFTFVHIALMDFEDELRRFLFLKLAATKRSTNVSKTFDSM